MPISLLRSRLPRPLTQARFRLRVVVPPPLPEELLDLRHVRAAGDVLHALVVDRSAPSSRRTACRRSRSASPSPSPSGPACTPSADGSTSTFSTRFSGGTTTSRISVCTLPSATVTASTKKFGMSFWTTAISSSMLLPLQAQHLRRQVDAVGRPHEQQHRAVGAVGVDQQLDLLAGRVLALVGDQLEVVEAEVACRRSPRRAPRRRSRPRWCASWRRSPCTTGDTGPASAALICCRAWPSASVSSFQVCDRLLDRLVLVVVGDLVQRQFALALRPASGRASGP